MSPRSPKSTLPYWTFGPPPGPGPRRPNDAVAELVALLHDVEDGAALGLLRRLREKRLVDVRIELPVGRDELDAVPLEQRRERAVDETDALLELRLIGVGLPEPIR